MKYNRTNKSKKLCARVDEETYEILKSKAKEFENISECLRHLILHDVPAKNTHVLESILNMQYELRKIGVNINQITKNNNSQFYTPTDKTNLEKHLETIKELENIIINEVMKP